MQSAMIENHQDFATDERTTLPFVKLGQSGRLEYWNVRSVGDVGLDNMTGRLFARETIHYVARTDDHPLMVCVLRGLMEKPYGDVEAGFMAELAEHAVRGL